MERNDRALCGRFLIKEGFGMCSINDGFVFEHCFHEDKSQRISSLRG